LLNKRLKALDCGADKNPGLLLGLPNQGFALGAKFRPTLGADGADRILGPEPLSKTLFEVDFLPWKKPLKVFDQAFEPFLP